jgi:hypothetical protein
LPVIAGAVVGKEFAGAVVVPMTVPSKLQSYDVTPVVQPVTCNVIGLDCTTGFGVAVIAVHLGRSAAMSGTMPPSSSSSEGLTAMDRLDAAKLELSCALIVNEYEPLVVGVPEINADVGPDALSNSPAGNEPAVIDQETVPLAPLVATVCEYAVPTRPVAKLFVVIVIALATLTSATQAKRAIS